MNSEVIKYSNFSELTSKYQTFLFDCDGVLWSGKYKIEEAFKALNYLKSKRKGIYFITNGSAKSREALFKKITGFDFECHLEDAYPTSYLASAYLKLHDPDIKSIYVVGRDGIVEEARKAGLEVHGGPEDDDKQLLDEEELREMSVKDVDAVVCGMDMQFNYYKLCYACACIRNGAKFYATNDDAFDQLGDRRQPAAGCMIAAIEKCTGKKAIVLGKPNKYAYEVLVEEHNLNKKDCLMIGDRLDTDIMLGINSGIDSCLVMTGTTTEEILKGEYANKNSNMPTYICKDLSLRNEFQECSK